MKPNLWPICFGMFLGGCIAFTPPRNDGAKIYALSPKEFASSHMDPDRTPIGLLAIVLPEYLRGPTWLHWESDVQLKPIKTFRWAEPLELNMARVIATNLNTYCKNVNVEAVPWLSEKNKKLWIKISVNECRHKVLESTLSFVGNWKIYDREMKQILKSCGFHIDTKSIDTPESVVRQLNEILWELSKNIAAKLVEELMIHES